jgi:hypothetical protein
LIGAYTDLVIVRLVEVSLVSVYLSSSEDVLDRLRNLRSNAITLNQGNCVFSLYPIPFLVHVSNMLFDRNAADVADLSG